MQDFNDELGTTGQGTAIIIGDRDETQLNNMVTLADGADNEDVTTFQPQGNAKEYAYLLNSGTIAVKGFLSQSAAIVKAQLAQVLGKSREKPVVIVGKYGLAPGTEANFARALSNTHNANHSLTGVTSADATLALTGTGIVDGVSLHRVFGDTTPGQSEVQKLVFTNADPLVFRGLRAVGTTEVFPFNFATTNAALGAGIAALPAYVGRVVTVTGDPVTGATLKSGEKRIAFDGAVDVPQLEIVSGLIEILAVNNGVGNYTLNGGAPFQLGFTEGALQTNQRNLGGARQSVIVKGSSVANTGPGQIDSFSGTGDLFSINHAGKTAVSPNFALGTGTAAQISETIRVDFETRYRLSGADGDSQRAGAAVEGTFAKGVKVNKSTPSTGTAFGLAGAVNAYDENDATTVTINPGGSTVANASVGWTFNTPLIINAIRVRDTISNAILRASAIGDFSDTVDLKTFSGGQPLTANTVINVTNTTAYKTYTLQSTEGFAVTIRGVELMADSLPSANGTITHDATKGALGTATFTGADYTGSTTPAQPNGTASFKNYYPLSVAPAAPAATGLNAAVARLAAPVDIAAATIQRSTGLDANFSYNFVNASDAGEWIDYGVNSPHGFHLAASVLDATGNNASLAIIVETADADNAGAPVPASIVTLHEFAPFTARGYSMISQTTPVKRLIRVRYVIAGGGEFVFAVALAPR